MRGRLWLPRPAARHLGRGVVLPVARRARADAVELRLYLLLLSQEAVEHDPGSVIALLDHDPCALAQGYGGADATAVQDTGTVGLDVGGEHGDLAVEVHLAAGSGPVEREQDRQLDEAGCEEALVRVQGDGLAG